MKIKWLLTSLFLLCSCDDLGRNFSTGREKIRSVQSPDAKDSPARQEEKSEDSKNNVDDQEEMEKIVELVTTEIVDPMARETDCFDKPLDSNNILFKGNTPIFIEAGENLSFCEILSRDTKTTAVLYHVSQPCEACKKEIESIYLGLGRQNLNDKVSLIIALPNSSQDLIDEMQMFLTSENIHAHLVTESQPHILVEIMAQDMLMDVPRFSALNGLLEINYLPDSQSSQYLKIIEFAHKLYQSAGGQKVAADQLPPFSWDGLKPKSTGLVDLFSITSLPSNKGI